MSASNLPASPSRGLSWEDGLPDSEGRAVQLDHQGHHLLWRSYVKQEPPPLRSDLFFSEFSHSVVSDSRNPMDCSMPGFPVPTNSQRLFKLMSIEMVMPSNHLIFCCALLLLRSIFILR